MAETVSVERPADVGPLGFGRPTMLGVGTMIWLGSELMFFSGLFAAFFTIRAHATVWPPPGDRVDIVQSGVFTLILLASSFTMQKGVWEEEHERRSSARWWVVITIIMGTAFLTNQLVEWNTVPFRAHTDAYGSLFFLMTGLHGLHVFIGLVALSGVLARMIGPKGDPGEHAVYQAVSYYWHFVDIVWIGLYSALFLLK